MCVDSPQSLAVLDLAHLTGTLEGVTKYDAYLVCFKSPVPVPHTTERCTTAVFAAPCPQMAH